MRGVGVVRLVASQFYGVYVYEVASVKPLYHLLLYLFLVFELLGVEAVEQQSQEEVKDHEVAHDEGRKEDEEASLRAINLFCSHTVPQGFNPLPAQDTEDHHERVEEIIEVPSEIIPASITFKWL